MRCRWDWHAWQLFVACLPPLGMPCSSWFLRSRTSVPAFLTRHARAAAVLGLAAYARKEMEEREALLQSEVGGPLP